MLNPERFYCWADVKSIGLVIGFSRIILISNAIVFHTISMSTEIFFQEAVVPLLFVCFDICWIHGIYKEKPKLLLPTLVSVTIEIAALISLALYNLLIVYTNLSIESKALTIIIFAVSLAIESFVWMIGYTLFKRMKKTQGFQNIEFVDAIKIV